MQGLNPQATADIPTEGLNKQATKDIITTGETTERVSFGQRLHRWWRNLFTRKNQNQIENEFLINNSNNKKVPTKNWVGLGCGIVLTLAGLGFVAYFGQAATVISTLTFGMAAFFPPVLIALLTISCIATVLSITLLAYNAVKINRARKELYEENHKSNPENSKLNPENSKLNPENSQTLTPQDPLTPQYFQQPSVEYNDEQK